MLFHNIICKSYIYIQKNPVYFRNHKGLIVSVFIGKDPSNKKIAKKIYEYQLEDDKKSIENEIEIMKSLSARAKPDNCFLELYGCTIENNRKENEKNAEEDNKENNKAILYMEAHEHTLIDIISAKKARKNKFDRDLLHKLIIKLIQAFAEMAALRIYHRDIKPHNMLYTSDDNLKIIDFGISEKISSMDFTMPATGIHQIQGTAGYWAPELEELHNSGEVKGKYKPGKADVFSLGLTIYQMITLEQTTALNFISSNETLLTNVNKLPDVETWVTLLLAGMLQADVKRRFSFQKCLSYLPSDSQTYVATIRK